MGEPPAIFAAQNQVGSILDMALVFRSSLVRRNPSVFGHFDWRLNVSILRYGISSVLSKFILLILRL